MPTKEELKMLQALPLEIKVAKTKQRIREFVERFGEDGVYVSFSGGKDSTVLLHIVRSIYPDIEAVFVNTGLEYPEIQQFVKTFDNVTILHPKMRFDEVIRKHGYPIISKEVANTVHGARISVKKGKYSLRLCKLGVEPHEVGVLHDGKHDYEAALANSKFKQIKWMPLLNVDFNLSSYCCDINKKAPLHDFEKSAGKVAIIGTMTGESQLRLQQWLQSGCNAFERNRALSKPISFWNEQDVLRYIKENKVPIASVYGDIVFKDDDGYEYDSALLYGGKLHTTGCDRTGCVYCGFGCHLEGEPSRFQRLKETHPRQYEYCISGGEYDENGIWKPNKEGLGMGHVFDELNKIYGEGFIKYK